jgi:hypothetical protein
LQQTAKVTVGLFRYPGGHYAQQLHAVFPWHIRLSDHCPASRGAAAAGKEAPYLHKFTLFTTTKNFTRKQRYETGEELRG